MVEREKQFPAISFLRLNYFLTDTCVVLSYISYKLAIYR